MKRPAYPLDRFSRLIERRDRVITSSAKQGAYALGFDDDDIVEIVRELKIASFYKSMPAGKMPGFFQDVYRVKTRGVCLYIKLQVRNERAGIVSFKKDESAEE